MCHAKVCLVDNELVFQFVLKFITSTFPPTVSMSDPRFLKRKAKRCQFIEGQIFCRGRRILPSDVIEDQMRSLH